MKNILALALIAVAVSAHGKNDRKKEVRAGHDQSKSREESKGHPKDSCEHIGKKLIWNTEHADIIT